MQLPFYYDYACPWAYLASCRVEAFVAGLGAEVDFRPVQLFSLKEAPPTTEAPPMGKRKEAWYYDDLQSWSDFVGADVDITPRHLIEKSTRRALKAALVAKDAGRLREFHYPAYRARWAEARNVADPVVLRELLGAAGLDPDAAMEQVESPELEARIERDTQDAIARGVFGVPTLFVGDRMFWGNDRFDLVRFYLEKARQP
jgi:2-hydroxychromene-2-carboxylate isomerase